MLVVSCQTLAMLALSPVICWKVQSLVFSEDDSALFFVDGSGTFGAWHHNEFHQRVHGGMLHSLCFTTGQLKLGDILCAVLRSLYAAQVMKFECVYGGIVSYCYSLCTA